MTTQNPFYDFRNPPRFDALSPELAEVAIGDMIASAHEALDALETDPQPTWAQLMTPAYRLMEPLDFAWGLVSHYMGVLNSDEWRKVHEALQPEVVALGLRMGQSEPLYRTMCELRDSSEWVTLHVAQQRILATAIRSAELSGVGLAGSARERFGAIKTRLAALSTQFNNHVLDARKAYRLVLKSKADIAGLPDSLRARMAEAATADGHPEATAESGPWTLSLDYPVMGPFLQYSERRPLRETLYRAFVTVASDGELDNMPLVEEILALRHELATLLGYSCYAEVSLASKMAPDVAAVDALLEELYDAAYPRARHELDTLQTFARERGCDYELAHWDIAFWSEKLRESRFAFNDETLRPYFQFPRVLDGLFSLTQRLFGVRIEAADGEVPVWHPDVRHFKIFDADDALCARFYLDPYSRPDTKRGGAWMDPVRPLDTTSASTSLPIAYLVCNQTRPSAEHPSLMTFSEVETLFHEFGHGLQHMLTKVGEPEASGLNNIEWDAVELASQFMENWCYEQSTLRALSQHIETGASIPDDLFTKIVEARTFQSGSMTLRQLSFGMLDMDLHARFTPQNGQSVRDIVDRNNRKTRLLHPLPEDRTLCAFSHVFGGGYAAGYYSYKWSEVLSADAFAAFEEAGLHDMDALSDVGMRFRDTVLALGGGTPPAEVFRRFRGREPDAKALLRQDGLLPDDAH